MLDYIKLRRKYNTLESKYESLVEDIKNECFDKVLKAIGHPVEIKRLREENKRLRIKIKELKGKIK